MKWLNKIFGREKIPTTTAFDDIDAWLETASGALFPSLSTTASRVYGEIEDVRDRLRQNISKIQDAEPAENIPSPITKSGLNARDKMVKRLNYLVEKMSIPTQTDYKTILSFHRMMTSNMEFALAIPQKNIYYIRSLFPDEVEKIVSNLDRLKTIFNKLIVPLLKKESKIVSLDKVPEIVRSVKDIRSTIEKQKEMVSDREEEITALEKRIEAEEERIRILEEGEEWMRLQELGNELSSLEKELNGFEADLTRLLSPIDKALKLLKKQDETGRHTLALEDRRVLSLILSSPIHALDENVGDFLHTLRHIIEGDVLPLKGRRRDKTLRWIDHLLNAEILSLRERRNILQSNIGKTKDQLSGLTILKDRREIERSIISAKGQLARLQEETDRSKKHIDSLEKSLDGEVRLLLKALEDIAGKKIDVNL
ncbi:MAG: hypothetical protein PHD13_01020 [Methanocellales archaeon]|nr:hypothetical protein [Methanocellales archaeon]MDD3291367.1 hypothetical protein [Methanocellales archaeon]MDD5234743.1 hypothetical protein [Methanocellales archaeon]MDD5484906.1 hypothetical protein [Methanocellales archaeon]